MTANMIAAFRRWWRRRGDRRYDAMARELGYESAAHLQASRIIPNLARPWTRQSITAALLGLRYVRGVTFALERPGYLVVYLTIGPRWLRRWLQRGVQDAAEDLLRRQLPAGALWLVEVK